MNRKPHCKLGLLLLMLIASLTAQSANWCEIVVSTPGTLETLLESKSASAIESVRITGKLNTADLKYMTKGDNNIAHIKNLDLRGVTLIPNESEYYTNVKVSHSSISVMNFYCYISDTNRQESSSNEWLGTIVGNNRFYGNCFAGAFTKFSSLNTIYLPDYMTEIGAAAFYGSPVQNVVISGKIKKIGHFAFFKSKIKKLECPNTLTEIGQNAFAYSTIESITGTDNVESINYYAFSESNLKSATFPKAKTLKEGAFSNTAITKYDIAEGTKTIEESLFNDCSNLTNISIPTSVDSVGNMAFHNTPWILNNKGEGGIIYINNSAYCFARGVSLTNYNFKEGTTHICDAFIANADGYQTYSYYYGTEPSVPYNITFPTSLIRIGRSAFYSLNNLRNVDLGGVKYIEQYAFANCTGINVKEFPKGIEVLDYHAFYNSQTDIIFRCKNVRYSSNGGKVFSDNLTKIYFGKEVDVIPRTRIFDELTQLRTIEFEDRPENNPLIIEDGAFGSSEMGYANREIINLPKNVPYFGRDCFNGRLYYCKFDHTVDFSNTHTVGEDAFYNCETAFDPYGTLTLPHTMTRIEPRAFGGNNVIQHVIVECDSLASAAKAFGLYDDHYPYYYTGSYNIKSVLVKANVKILPGGIFALCRNLKKIEFEPRPHDNYVPLIVQNNIVGALNDSNKDWISKIDSITLPYGTIEVGANMMDPALKYMELPETLERFNWFYIPLERVSYKYSKEFSIVCKAETPPDYVEGFDSYLDKSEKTKCFVPAKSVEAYQADKDWNRYFTILPIPGTEVESGNESGGEGDGDGNEDNHDPSYPTNPITAAQALELGPSDTPVWIKGYIVGATATYSGIYRAFYKPPFTSSSGIIISDNKEPGLEQISVEFYGESTPREKLNLMDNPENYGKSVAIYGIIGNHYYTTSNSALAILNASAYVLDYPMNQSSISEISSEQYANKAVYYDLQGRKHSSPVHGINIINGKKIYIP